MPVSAWTAVLIFAGLPAAVVGLVFAAVVLSNGRERPHDPGIVVGLVHQEVGCAVETDAEGHVVHEPRPGAAPTCFTARCAECQAVHRDGTGAVHFAGRRQGTETVLARGWRLAGPRLRCPRCA